MFLGGIFRDAWRRTGVALVLAGAEPLQANAKANGLRIAPHKDRPVALLSNRVEPRTTAERALNLSNFLVLLGVSYHRGLGVTYSE